jgi:hypothetical protein
MVEFKIGDKVEINYHTERKYIGQKGKITFTGRNLMEGTAPSDFRQVDVDENYRYIVLLDNSTLLSDLRVEQLRKV